MVTLFTVGHGTATEEGFLALLTDAGLTEIVDVRRFPGSRRNPHFGRERMARWLPEHDIAYRWDERLGGRRRPVERSVHTGWRNRSFQAYADHLDTEVFRQAVDDLLEDAAQRPTAVLCAETLWWRCHRRLIADHVTLLTPHDVRHLLPDGRLVEHVPTDVVRVVGSRLRYDGDPHR